jgi:hypothetical protein
MRAIVVSVEYDDYLKITLPRNYKHFDEILVVTSVDDTRTQEYARTFSNVKLLETNIFYRGNSIFNKGASIELAFDVFGRSGWLTILDADIVLPEDVHEFWPGFRSGNLYSPYRRMLYDPLLFNDNLDWSEYGIRNDTEFAGYMQCFHCNDPVLMDRRPWYGVDSPHAGACDSDFQLLWQNENKIRPEFKVLHLGKTDRNWGGRCEDRLDGISVQDQFIRRRIMNEIKNSCMPRVIEHRETDKYPGFKIGNNGTILTNWLCNGKKWHQGERWVVADLEIRKQTGYLSVWNPISKERCPVHIMVLEAFVGPCPLGQEALHKDSNPSNNWLYNLSWGTRLDNRLDDLRRGIYESGNRVLSPVNVIEIRRRYKYEKYRIVDLALEYNMSESMISDIVHRRKWTHV